MLKAECGGAEVKNLNFFLTEILLKLLNLIKFGLKID